MSDIPKPESAQRTVWIGQGGEEHACEQDAVISFVEQRLTDLIDRVSDPDGADPRHAAQMLIGARKDVLRWLQAVEDANA